MKTIVLISLLLCSSFMAANGQVVGGYFPNYRSPDDANSIQYNKLSELYYSISFTLSSNIYVEENARFSQTTDPLFTILKAKCASNNVDLYLSVVNAGGSTAFSSIAADPTLRSNFVSQCADFCGNNGLKGIDIDWEAPTSSEAANFNLLLSALQTALKNKTQSTGKSYRISIAVAGYSSSKGFTKDAFQYIDYLHVMAYDAPVLSYPTNHSPLSYMEDLMTQWANVGCPYGKMVAGLPFYGRKIILSTAAAYKDISDGSYNAYISDSFNGYGYNGQPTIAAKVNYALVKGARGLFAWELTQDRNDQYSLLSAMRTAANSFASCIDKNEPNDDITAATASFTSPLNATSQSVTLSGIIPDPSDQDWYKIPVDGKGTLTISLTNLPADYDLELYPINGLSGGALKGSYNVSATSENITYNYTTSASTILYAKVYPKNSSQYSACGKYSLTINWAPPSQAACTTPQAPVATYGADACSAPLTVTDPQNIALSFTSNGGNTFGAQVSKYPYGTANIVVPSSCQPTTASIPVNGLVKGMLYRWNMYAYGSTDCSSCQSPVSNTKYFGLAPEITATTTQLPSSGSITINTIAEVPGSGATINYKWLKNGAVYQQGASLTSLSVTSAGSYTLVIEYSGGGNCGVTAATSASNAITVTAAITCTNSVTPNSLTQGVANTPNGAQVLLTVNGGSLGTNATWRLYSGNCGGTLEQSGHATTFIVNPSVTTTYYLRAEGDCNVTDCVSTQVVVPCVNSVMPSSVSVSTGNTPNGPKSILTVVGGSLGTNATWRVYSGGCGNVLEGSGHANTFLFNPAVTTTYYIRAEGDCNFTDCATATIYVKPMITAFSPSTSITGQSVTLTGTNLTGATTVSFGGTPAALFTVNSPTSITAVVGAGASGIISVTTPGGTTTIGGFNYVFSLPTINFNLSSVSATCRGSNNGLVKIIAGQHLNYNAVITGNGLNTPYPFTDSVSISNLAVGTYNVCIGVSGQPNYQQCYSLVINQPQDLAVYVASINPGNQVVLNLSGGTVYSVSLNGVTTVTGNNQINLQLVAGLNRIVISTDKACQGSVEKDITIADEKTAYPNPFDQIVNVSLGKDLIQQAEVSVLRIDGQTEYNQTFTKASGSIQINLSNLQSGQYLLKLSADSKVTVFKIVKR